MIDPVYSAAPDRYSCEGMQYRRCGRSGVLLPVISLGMWHNFGDTAPRRRAQEMIHYAFDHGVTHFDLANNYGPSYGSAEENFGQIMRSSMHPYRDEMFISTKAGHDMWPGPYGEWGSRKYLMASLDQSLRRMNLDYVDVFYSHRYDPDTPLEETMQALVDIVRSGKALYVGISKYPLEVARQAYDYLSRRDVPCLVYQGRYSILDQDLQRSAIMADAADHGVGITAFSPLAQGLLSDRYLSGHVPADSRMAQEHFLKSSTLTPEMLAALNALNRMAADRGQALAQMALSWVLSHPEVTSVIVGASSVDQLATTLQTASQPLLTADELKRIDSIIANVPH